MVLIWDPDFGNYLNAESPLVAAVEPILLCRLGKAARHALEYGLEELRVLGFRV